MTRSSPPAASRLVRWGHQRLAARRATGAVPHDARWSRRRARPAPAAARRCDTVTTRALLARPGCLCVAGRTRLRAQHPAAAGGRAGGRAPSGLGATRTVGLRPEISANPPGQMSNLRFTAKKAPKAPCKKALTSDFTLGSSSLLRGVPTHDLALPGLGHPGVLIAPTRSSNDLLLTADATPDSSSSLLRGVPTGRGRRGGARRGGPHRSYEEFQPVSRFGGLDFCESSSLLRGVPTGLGSAGRLLAGSSSSLLRGVPTRRRRVGGGAGLPRVLIAPTRSSNVSCWLHQLPARVQSSSLLRGVPTARRRPEYVALLVLIAPTRSSNASLCPPVDDVLIAPTRSSNSGLTLSRASMRSASSSLLRGVPTSEWFPIRGSGAPVLIAPTRSSIPASCE